MRKISGNVTRMTSKLGQRIVIFDGIVFTFDCQHTAFSEATQQTADGFTVRAQIVTDIATSHRQAEFTEKPALAKRRTGWMNAARRSSAFFFDNSKIMS